MEKAIYWQKGVSIDYINTTDKVIESNSIVALGSHIGIAGGDIAAGETGILFVEGVFKLPKGDVEFALGDPVYFDAEKGVMTKTATNPEDMPAGYAAEAASSVASVVLTKLLG